MTDDDPTEVPAAGARLEAALAPATGLAVLAFALGQLHYRVLVARNPDADLPIDLSAAELVTAQSFRMALVVLLCALAGLFWKERAGLPGIGAWPGTRRAATLFGLGLLGALGSTALYDWHFRAIAPGLYPGDLADALQLFPMNPLVDEVIARMGLLTLIAGLTGRTGASIALHAIAVTMLATFTHYRLAGWPEATDPLLWSGLACGLTLQAALGIAYRRHGLVGASIAHAGLQTKLFWLTG